MTYRHFGKRRVRNRVSAPLFTNRFRRRFIIPPISLWNAVTVYFTSRRFMIAINISINDLLNYNCDRYLPTQLQGGVGRNLCGHLSPLPHPLLTASQFEMCAVILNIVHIGMLFLLDLTPFVSVTFSFNFRRPYIPSLWLMCPLSYPSAAVPGIKQIILPPLALTYCCSVRQYHHH